MCATQELSGRVAIDCVMLYDCWAGALTPESRAQGVPTKIPTCTVESGDWAAHRWGIVNLGTCHYACNFIAPDTAHQSFADSSLWAPTFLARANGAMGSGEERHMLHASVAKVGKVRTNAGAHHALLMLCSRFAHALLMLCSRFAHACSCFSDSMSSIMTRAALGCLCSACAVGQRGGCGRTCAASGVAEADEPGERHRHRPGAYMHIKHLHLPHSSLCATHDQPACVQQARESKAKWEKRRSFKIECGIELERAASGPEVIQDKPKVVVGKLIEEKVSADDEDIGGEEKALSSSVPVPMTSSSVPVPPVPMA